MDCEQCGAPLDVSATKDNFLRCKPCRLVFVVKKEGELQGLAMKAPDGIDPDDFFASFTANLGFEEDDEPESTEEGADAQGQGRSRGLLLVGLLVLAVVTATVVLLRRGGLG